MNVAIWQRRHKVPDIGTFVGDPAHTTQTTSVKGGPVSVHSLSQDDRIYDERICYMMNGCNIIQTKDISIILHNKNKSIGSWQIRYIFIIYSDSRIC